MLRSRIAWSYCACAAIGLNLLAYIRGSALLQTGVIGGQIRSTALSAPHGQIRTVRDSDLLQLIWRAADGFIHRFGKKGNNQSLKDASECAAQICFSARSAVSPSSKQQSRTRCSSIWPGTPGERLNMEATPCTDVGLNVDQNYISTVQAAQPL
ncbi:uncharacterized protein LOC107197111 isoform X2 [Astyanax mexicanus]|uniref:uncharacterized protein LOC107197111 isoform X2 n=1 Tax=Astyanax mexicanus TaxID=7994 RepID=UPI000BBD5400|nr:uncharacterized protein LOC107197111 isoform X2 [Astyanax mexicanus]